MPVRKVEAIDAIRNLGRLLEMDILKNRSFKNWTNLTLKRKHKTHLRGGVPNEKSESLRTLFYHYTHTRAYKHTTPTLKFAFWFDSPTKKKHTIDHEKYQRSFSQRTQSGCCYLLDDEPEEDIFLALQGFSNHTMNLLDHKMEYFKSIGHLWILWIGTLYMHALAQF